jgi:hypothetical protein
MNENSKISRAILLFGVILFTSGLTLVIGPMLVKAMANAIIDGGIEREYEF